MTPSMSRPGNPYDNAQCESFIKTLKQEEIYCHSYRDLEDLRPSSAGVHRGLLQPPPSAFGARLPNASGIRSREADRSAGKNPQPRASS